MNIMDYIKPELIVLAIALYFIGMGLKKSQVKDKWIPYILGAVGVTLAFVYVIATSDLSTAQGVLLAVFGGVTQGILCAGMSVYVNQLIKQGSKGE